MKSSQTSNHSSRRNPGVRILAGSIAVFLAAQAAQAAPHYWDTNETTADFGFTTRIWGTDANWTTDSTGNFTTGVTATTTSADAAIFHFNDVNGLLSVNVSGDVYANNVLQWANGSAKATTFNDGGSGKIHLYSTSSANGAAAIDGQQNDSNLTINVPVVLNQADGSDVYFGVGGGNNGGLFLSGGVTHAVPANSVNLYFNNAGNTGISGGALNIKGTITNTGADSNLVKSVTISANIGSGVTTVNQSSGLSHSMVLSGTNSYTGASTAHSGLLQFNSLAAIGGTGKSAVANLGGAIGFGAGMSNADLATALATRIDPTSTGGIAVNGNTARNFDFAAAGLSNVSLGASYGGGSNAQTTYTGTFTPFGSNYRLGGAGGRLIMNQVNALTGSNDVTVTGIGTGFSNTIGNSAVSLTNANNYSGVTSINSGTFVLSGAAGAITSTTGITLNGGNFTLINTTTAQGAVDRVAAAAITSNGGTLTYTNTSGAGNVYAETVGAVGLTAGQLNVVLTTNQAGGGGNIQTLTLGGLAQFGMGTVTFSAAPTAPNATTNIIQVTGAGATVANQIIGPWATLGTAANAQTDYAIYDVSTNLVAANLAATGEVTWTTPGNAYSLSGATSLTAARTITALRFTGGTATLALAGNNLETFGILNGGTNTLTISSTGGVLRQQGTAAASVFLTTGNRAITITAPVQDNTGALTLVKSGSGGTLTLSGNNIYTGGTVINAGTLTAGSATAFGTNAPMTLANFAGALVDITGFNNSVGSLTGGGVNGGNVTLGAATLTVGGDNTNPPAYAGAISGTGALIKTGTGTQILAGTSTYSGATTVSNGTLMARSAAALGTTAAGTTVAAGATLDVQVNIGTEALSIAGSGFGAAGALIASAGTGRVGGAVTLTADASVGGAGALTVSGAIGGGFNLTKVGAGTTTLSGANTYFGATTVSTGALLVSGSLAETDVAVAGGASLAGTGTIGTLTAGSVTLAAGASAGARGAIDLVDGSIGTLTLAARTATGTVLTLGDAANPSTVKFEVGATADQLVLGANAQASIGAGGFLVDLTASAALNGSTLVLIDAPAGLAAGSFGSAAVGATAGNFGGYNLALTSTATDLSLTQTANAAPAAAFWKGTNNAVWTTFSGGNANISNFATDLAGTNATGKVGAATEVNFNATSTANFASTTMGEDLTVKTLTFGSNATAAVGIGGTHTLTISPAAATAGITVDSGSGNHTLNTKVALGADQTWTVTDLTQTLTLSNQVSGIFGLTKAGAGALVLSGANASTGLTTVAAGTLEVIGGAAVDNTVEVIVAPVAGARLLVSTSETIGALSGGSGANGEVALGGQTLTVGDATPTTFGGTISGSAATGRLIKQGGGVLNLAPTAVLAFDRLTANDGTLNVNSPLGTAPGTAVVDVNGAATKLRFGSVSQTLSSLTIGAGTTVIFTSGAATGAFSGGGKAGGFGGAVVVPEPGTLGLLLVGALGVFNRRRRG